MGGVPDSSGPERAAHTARQCPARKAAVDRTQSMQKYQRAICAGGLALALSCGPAAKNAPERTDVGYENTAGSPLVEPTGGTDASTAGSPLIIPIGGTPGGSAGAGSGAPRDPAQCAQARANTTRITPRVILVLDGSCSMSTDYPANGKASATRCVENANGRWAALRRALLDAQSGVIAKLQSVVQFGLATYGTAPTCPLPAQPVVPALDNLRAIEAKLPAVQPGMYTPTGPALDWVYDNLIEPVRPDAVNPPQIVILATDGEPNSCNGGGGGAMTNYQPSIDAVTKGTKLGVKTYVFSLADATGAFHDHLQQLANLGNPAANGAAKLYEPTSPAQLASDLQSLVGAAVSCEIALDGAVEKGSECTGSVSLNGRALGCNQADGWKLLDAKRIELQGAACTELKRDNALVDARFPCTVFTPN